MRITIVLLALPLIPLVATVVVLFRRNRMPPALRAPAVIYLAQIIGASAAGISIVAALSLVRAVFEPSTAVHAVVATAPFSPWPLPSAEASRGPEVMVADIDRVRVGVAHADVTTQVLQALGAVLSALPVITVGVFVAILSERIIRRSAFAAQLVRFSWVAAAMFLVAGFAGQLVSGLASFRLAEIAFRLIRETDASATLPSPTWPAPIELWPLWGSLALAVLAVLIRHGVVLQKETEGLV